MSGDFNPDPMPQPGDGPEYEANLLAWIARNPAHALDKIQIKAAEELEAWWMECAIEEIAKTVPKAIEYGAGDLEAIGRDLRMTGISAEGATPDDELGVYFYLVGKMARWRSAIERGERVSEDTLLDIGVYVRMAQRIRSHGGWPGTSQARSTCTNPTVHDPLCECGITGNKRYPKEGK